MAKFMSEFQKMFILIRCISLEKNYNLNLSLSSEGLKKDEMTIKLKKFVTFRYKSRVYLTIKVRNHEICNTKNFLTLINLTLENF